MQTKLKPRTNALVLIINVGTSQQAVAAIKTQFPNSDVVACESLDAAVSGLQESRQPFQIICLGTREFLARTGDGRSYLGVLRDTLKELGRSADAKFYFFSSKENKISEVSGH